MLRQSICTLLMLINSDEMLAQTTNELTERERECAAQSRKVWPDEERSFFRECMTDVTRRQSTPTIRTAPRQRQVPPQQRQGPFWDW